MTAYRTDVTVQWEPWAQRYVVRDSSGHFADGGFSWWAIVWCPWCPVVCGAWWLLKKGVFIFWVANIYWWPISALTWTNAEGQFLPGGVEIIQAEVSDCD